MDNLNNQAFKCLCTTLFLLILITHTAYSSPSSNQEIQPQNPSPSTTTSTLAHYHQVFYLKNKDPTMFVTRQERAKKRMRINRNKKMKHMRKKKMVKNLHQSRPFSVMLPKGFVPPSGSLPCHNDQPTSMFSSFHCHLATNAQP